METHTDPTPNGKVPPHVFDLVASSIPGGRKELAQMLGISVAAIGNWKERGEVPVRYCARIDTATGGRVSRRDLRPADWQDYWPDMAATNSEQKQPSSLDCQVMCAIGSEVV